jgi:anthranilate synthase component 1
MHFRLALPLALPQVSQHGSVVVEKLMEVERYSHVMHISSTGAVQCGTSGTRYKALLLPFGTLPALPACRQA